jgi:hypothetical protein
MAVDLDESPVVLARAREAGDIPPPRHDQVIIARGIFMNRHVTPAAMEKHRNWRSIQIAKAGRSETIGKFYDAVGGIEVVSLKTGLSKNSLHVCKSRGVLSRRWKYELMQLAAEFEVPLADDIFSPPDAA